MTDRLNLTAEKAVEQDSYYEHALHFTEDGGRVVDDGRVTDGNDTISSPSVRFVSADVGASIFGTGIALGTTIATVGTDGTTATMSGPAIATALTGATFIVRALDVSLYSFAAQIRKRARSDEILATFGIDVTNAAGGEVLLTLLPSQTSRDLSGAWDFMATINSLPDPWFEGAVQYKPVVTRL